MGHPLSYFTLESILVPLGMEGMQVVMKLISCGPPQSKGNLETLMGYFILQDSNHSNIKDFNSIDLNVFLFLL